MSHSTSVLHCNFQYFMLSQHLFRRRFPEPKTHTVLNRIAAACLSEIYQNHFGGHSHLAKLEWNAKPIDSDFRVLQLAFKSFGKKAARSSAQQRWDLEEYYRFLKNEKLKTGRIEL